MKFIYKIYIIVLVVIMSMTNAVASDTADNIKSASCLINTEQGIVWVQDGWTRKLSLPGGVRKSGESPQQNAIRETFEETGLRATIVRPLKLIKSFQLFECRVESVPVIGLVVGRKLGLTPMLRLNTENSPNNGTEILGAWITGLNNDDKIYRFKKQIAVLKTIDTTSISPIVKKQIQISSLYKFDLLLIKKLQGYKNSVLDRVFKIFNALGTDKVFFVLLPFLFLLRGRLQDIQKILFITIISVLINGLFKVGFAMPRPLIVDTTVGHIKTAYGFGFPSGHTQVATTFWLSMAVWFARSNAWWVLFVFMGIMTGFARAYFGVHFFVDVIGAWILSGLIVYAGTKIKTLNLKYWLGLMLFSLPVMLYTESMDTLAISMVGAGIALVIRRMGAIELTDYSNKHRYIYSCVGIVCVFGLSAILSVVKSNVSSAGGIIIASIITYLIIGIVLQSLPYGIKKVWCK